MRDLIGYIKELKNENELIEINKFVDPVLEIAEITDRFSKQPGGGKALLFTNTGTDFHVLTNMMGSEKRICKVLHVTKLDEIGEEIKSSFSILQQNQKGFIEKLKIVPKLFQLARLMPKVKRGRGKCQEKLLLNNDITKLPVLQCWPNDGGRFVTLPLVHTKDLETGVRNTGMYRMQIFDKNLTGMHWHRHKGGAAHFEKYKKLNKKMPVAVAIGGDPVYTYAATAPLPENIDEYIFAGFLRKQKVKMVKCLTQDLEVPEDVDFVIEGYVDPSEELIWEGPFGDHTGFYSLPDWYPKFHITCITHKKDAVFPATLVGIPPQEDYWYAKATERIFLPLLQNTILPELLDMNLPAAGVGHNITLVKIENKYPGHSHKVMNALWGAGQMMFNKILVVFDEKVNISDFKEVYKALIENVNSEKDFIFSKGPLDILDHSTPLKGFGGKLCIDATTKSVTTEKFNVKEIDTEKLIKSNYHINYINQEFYTNGLPLLVIGIQKKKKNDIIEITELILAENDTIKYIVFTDIEAITYNNFHLIWLCAGNYNPERDTFLVKGNKNKIIAFDCTSKQKEVDDFNDTWPEIALSDEKTISKINLKWKELGLNYYLSSPSDVFRTK